MVACRHAKAVRRLCRTSKGRPRKGECTGEPSVRHYYLPSHKDVSNQVTCRWRGATRLPRTHDWRCHDPVPEEAPVCACSDALGGCCRVGQHICKCLQCRLQSASVSFPTLSANACAVATAPACRHDVELCTVEAQTSHMHSCILCKPTRLLRARTRFLQARVIPASARGSCKRTRVLASTLTCACSVRSRWYAKNTLRPVPVGLSASVRYANSLQRHSSREEIRTAQDTAL